MKSLPLNLEKKIEGRRIENAVRNLIISQNLIDFSSNDYLGFAKSETIYKRASEILKHKNLQQNGATGSRLLTGNSGLYEATETFIANFHEAETALIFNSGYDANLGFFASVPQRGDVVFYDESIHASIRDGIKLGLAKAYKFKHNDPAPLRLPPKGGGLAREVYVVTESVFSMDGSRPDLKTLAEYCSKNNFRLIVDEAHALGVFEKNGGGLVQELNLQDQIFARIVTFGKALGCHGAAILGGKDLKDYLINFARSFIYTTALPPHCIATIRAAYSELETTTEREKLRQNIDFFNSEVQRHHLKDIFLSSNSAIQTCLIPGNENVKTIAEKLQKEGFDVKPILSPTVPEGRERLRFCLHSYNSEEEISEVLEAL